MTRNGRIVVRLFGACAFGIAHGAADPAFAGVDPEACCLQGDQCVDLPAEDCTGTPLGTGTSCAANSGDCVSVPAVSQWGLACLVLGVLVAATLLLRRSKRIDSVAALVGVLLIVFTPSRAAAQTTLKVQDPDGDGLRQIIVRPQAPPRVRVDRTPKFVSTESAGVVHRNHTARVEATFPAPEESVDASLDPFDASAPLGGRGSQKEQRSYPAPRDPLGIPEVSLSDANSVVAANTGFAEVQVLGKAITWGSGGAVPVRLEVEVGAGNGFVPLFGGNDVSAGIIEQIDLGASLAEVTFRATAAWPNFATPTWTRTVKSSETNAILLVNADNLNGIMAQRAVQPPYGGQLPLSDVVRNYVDQNSVVYLDNNRILILFELGSTNPNSSAYDFQDLVIAVDLEGIVQAPDFYLADPQIADPAYGEPDASFPTNCFLWSMVRAATNGSMVKGVAFEREQFTSLGIGERKIHACIAGNANPHWNNCVHNVVYTKTHVPGDREIDRADMAVTHNGFHAIAWLERNINTTIVKYMASFSLDDGQSWSGSPILLGSYAPDAGVFIDDIDVAANDDGDIAVLAYFNSGNSLVLYLFANGSTSPSVTPIVSGSGAVADLSCKGNCFALTGDVGNVFHAFYYQGPQNSAQAKVTTVAGGSITSNRNIGNSQAARSLSAGRALVSLPGTTGAGYYTAGTNYPTGARGLYFIPTTGSVMFKTTSFSLPGDLDDGYLNGTVRVGTTSSFNVKSSAVRTVEMDLDSTSPTTIVTMPLNDDQSIPFCPVELTSCQGHLELPSDPECNDLGVEHYCYHYKAGLLSGTGGVRVGDVYNFSTLLQKLHWNAALLRYTADDLATQQVVIHQTDSN